MQEIKTFRRSLWKGKMAIPLLIVSIVYVGGLIFALLYINLQDPKNNMHFWYVLFTGLGALIMMIGHMNYIILTETSIIFRNAILSRIKNEIKFEDIHSLSFIYPKRMGIGLLQIIFRGQNPDKGAARKYLDCVPPRDFEKIIQILREHRVFVQVFNQERWLHRKHGKLNLL